MVQTDIIERFNTTMGMVVKVKNDTLYKVGDDLLAESYKYRVKKILPNTRPDDSNTICLLVE